MRLIYLALIMIVGMMSCKKTNSIVQTIYPFQTMAPSTWVIYTYKDNTIQNPLIRSDTLIFLTDNQYTYNGTNTSYSLVEEQYNYYLSIQNTPFGNLSGKLQLNFLQQTEIINAPFTILTNNKTYYLWLKKIN